MVIPVQSAFIDTKAWNQLWACVELEKLLQNRQSHGQANIMVSMIFQIRSTDHSNFTKYLFQHWHAVDDIPNIAMNLYQHGHAKKMFSRVIFSSELCKDSKNVSPKFQIFKLGENIIAAQY